MPVIHAGTAHNVIPDSVEMNGTMRTLKADTREFGRRRIREVAEGVAASFGAKAELRFGDDGYPVTRNDPIAAERFRRTVRGLEGLRLMPDTLPVMGGEDFSFYGASGVPACFYWLGLKEPGTETYPNVHTPRFNFNDGAIPHGIQAMAALALSTG
jgi:metal-dependent amidase/aminoacylase/carboxypeptidase family protein